MRISGAVIVVLTTFSSHHTAAKELMVRDDRAVLCTQFSDRSPNDLLEKLSNHGSWLKNLSSLILKIMKLTLRSKLQ